jgi:hypothetical protein
MQDLLKAVAIAGIVVIEGAAILAGIDGAYFGICIAAIAGIAGYTIAKAKE